jgi:Leucine-rich repeat (LRR) protein
MKQAERQKIEKDVLDELQLMEDDLRHADMGRLEEMIDQLTDPMAPQSVVEKEKYLKDEKIRKRMQALQDKIFGALHKWKKNDDVRLPNEKNESYDETIGDMGGGIKNIVSDCGRPVSRRYKKFTINTDKVTNPLKVQPEKPSPVTNLDLPSIETVSRDTRMMEITRRFQSMLNKSVRNAFYPVFSIDKKYGKGSMVNVCRLAKTGDLAKSRYKTGSKAAYIPKEIVLRVTPGVSWNIITIELVHYLLEKGACFTVYINQAGYVNNIRTLSNLINVISMAETGFDDVIEKDLSRKRSDDYIVFTLPEPQALAEEDFLYGAIKHSPEKKEESDKLSFEEQLYRVKQFLRNNRLDDNENGKYLENVNHEQKTFELYLGCADVKNISDLSGLTCLTKFNIRKTLVDNIDVLADCITLTKLDISQCKVSNISVIAGLKKLNTLEMYGLPINNDDLKVLSNLENLVNLDIGRTKVTDLSSLSNLKNLEELILSNCTYIKNIDRLYNLPKLESVSFVRTSVSPLQIIELFECNPNRNKLDVLDSSWVGVTMNTNYYEYRQKHQSFLPEQLTFEEQIDKVKDFLRANGLDAGENSLCLENVDRAHETFELTLYNKKIKDISSLTGLTCLTKFCIQNTLIENIDVLADCVNLIELNIIYCKVTNINVIACLKKLKRLEMYGLPINNDDLKTLSNLESLVKLTIGETKVTDVSSLSNLKKLKILDFSFCTYLRNIDGLFNLPNLKRIYFHETLISPLQIIELFDRNPNRNELVVDDPKCKIISFQKNLNEYRKKYKSFIPVPPDHSSFIQEIYDALVNKVQSLQNVYKRLADEGNESLFKKAMTAVNQAVDDTIQQAVTPTDPGEVKSIFEAV